MMEELQQSIVAYDEMTAYPDVANATGLEGAVRGVETWSRQYSFDEVSGESVLPAEKFSNFALRLAAIYKGGSQRFIQETLNDLFDAIQGSARGTLFEEADKTPKSLAEAIRKVLEMEYKPVKQKKNGQNGINAVDLDTPQSEAGGSGSGGNAESGEREPGGTAEADGGAGAAEDRGEGKKKVNGKSVKPINYDNQGNPIDHVGKLIVDDVKSIDDITDDDFVNPTRTVGLPKLPSAVSDAIGSKDKRVIIKKNIFIKNHKNHKELTPAESRQILRTALYTPTLYGQNQKETRPFNWILIHLADKNTCVLLEVDNNKENCEIVNWHYLSGETLERKKRQAIREGGRILTLSEDNAAADTHDGLSSDGKGNTLSADKQKIGVESSEGLSGIDRESGRIDRDRKRSKWVDEEDAEEFEPGL